MDLKPDVSAFIIFVVKDADEKRHVIDFVIRLCQNDMPKEPFTVKTHAQIFLSVCSL